MQLCRIEDRRKAAAAPTRLWPPDRNDCRSVPALETETESEPNLVAFLGLCTEFKMRLRQASTVSFGHRKFVDDAGINQLIVKHHAKAPPQTFRERE